MNRKHTTLIRALAARMGRRGQFLALIGFGFGVYGVSMLIEPARPTPPGVFFIQSILPVWLRAGIWMVCAAVGIAYGIFKPRRDRWGFVALLIPPLSWALFMLLSWASLFVIGVGDRRGWASAIAWLCLAFAIHLVSGWAEPRVRAHFDALNGTRKEGRE